MKDNLDQWVAKNAFGLALQIVVHVSNYVKSRDERELLLRLIMNAIRQWQERKQ